jgi:hypothetical protein
MLVCCLQYVVIVVHLPSHRRLHPSRTGSTSFALYLGGNSLYRFASFLHTPALFPSDPVCALELHYGLRPDDGISDNAVPCFHLRRRAYYSSPPLLVPAQLILQLELAAEGALAILCHLPDVDIQNHYFATHALRPWTTPGPGMQRVSELRLELHHATRMEHLHELHYYHLADEESTSLPALEVVKRSAQHSPPIRC